MRRVRITGGDGTDRLNPFLERASFHVAAFTGLMAPAAAGILPGYTASLWMTAFAVSAAAWTVFTARSLASRIGSVPRTIDAGT